MNACRLCSCKADLINIFDPNLKNSRELRCFIVLATGIEIKETDIVSKFVCRRCCILAIKIYKFRTKAVANDKALKEQCGQHYSPPPSPSLSALDASRNQNESGGTSNQIRSHYVNSTTSTTIGTTTSSSNKIKRSSIRKHPSVDNLLKKHRNVKVPPRIFMSHINPVITLDRNEVKDWFDNHNSEGQTVFLNELKKLSQITIRKVPSISNKENYEILSNRNRRPCVATSSSTEKNGTTQHKEVEQEPISDNSGVSNCSRLLISSPKKANLKYPQVNVAKKRTGKPSRKKVDKRKKTHSESDSSDDELMPVPKKRSLIAPPSSNFQKIDLPSEKPASKETQKQIFTSSLELTPSRREEKETPSNEYELTSPVKNIMYSVREANLFICNVCNQIYDTKKELSDHQRSHLHCKFCKAKMKSIDALFEHLNEACFINLTKNLPNIVLTRVDEDAEIVNRFSDTFKRFKNDSYVCKIEDSSDSDVFEDCDSDDNRSITHIEEINVPMASSNLIEEIEVTPLIQSHTFGTLTDVHSKDSTETEFKNKTLVEALLGQSSNEEEGETLLEQYITKEINKAAEQQNNRKGNSKSPQEQSPDDNIVCISDDSDNETNTTKNKTKTKVPIANNDFTPMESVSIIRPEIRLAQKTILNPHSTQSINNQNLIHVEESIIQNLFKKYKISNQVNQYTQVFLPCDSSIKTLGNRLMCVENMFLELSIHKIPVELEFCNKIKINFQDIPEKKQPSNNFNWEKFVVNEIQNPESSSTVEVIQIDDDDSPSARNKQVSSGNSTAIPSKNSSGSDNGTEIPKDKNVAFSQPALLLNGSSFISTARTTVSSSQLPVPLAPSTSTSKTNTPSENIQTTSNSGLQPATNPTRSQFIPPLVISHSQSTSSNSGAILLNHLASSNGVLAAQKLISFPSSMFCSANSQPSTAYSQKVQPPPVPAILNTSINNFNKIVVIAPTGSLNQNTFSNFQTVATTTATPTYGNQVQISEIEKQSTTSKNSEQTSSSESPAPGQSLLRVKNLWELTEPKL